MGLLLVGMPCGNSDGHVVDRVKHLERTDVSTSVEKQVNHFRRLLATATGCL